jgi:hypothetical protein
MMTLRRMFAMALFEVWLSLKIVAIRLTPFLNTPQTWLDYKRDLVKLDGFLKELDEE